MSSLLLFFENWQNTVSSKHTMDSILCSLEIPSAKEIGLVYCRLVLGKFSERGQNTPRFFAKISQGPRTHCFWSPFYLLKPLCSVILFCFQPYCLLGSGYRFNYFSNPKLQSYQQSSKRYKQKNMTGFFTVTGQFLSSTCILVTFILLCVLFLLLLLLFCQRDKS